ncbi:hypothetical protein [Staphylococcus edaphicus]|uniref:Uncharacterized protein n=1 Tax=Staphylococcus edaphicus TaxID=1955013 RepID=A0A2C6WMG8_9STAP|nr:hypothetical protein [Staphylococcus edaphicus]PHK49343.1 hypothetical protein BTJ66_08480 [Staphylococcus edaphicus]UQW80493.1 hypothetical protein MNY58_07705 [Staphylococcus edaphicus]
MKKPSLRTILLTIFWILILLYAGYVTFGEHKFAYHPIVFLFLFAIGANLIRKVAPKDTYEKYQNNTDKLQ